MKLPAYPRTKPSGVEWLGDVPEHWGVKAIKWETPVLRGASPRPIDDPIYFDDDDGEYSWVRISDVTSAGTYLSATEQKLSRLGSSLSVKLKPGALFLSIAGSVGKPCITQIKCCIHDGFVYFPRFKGDAKFLYYLFASGEPYRGLGKLGTQLNLNTDTVGSIVAGFPDPAEQRAIAAFLDRETGRVDRLVAKKRELIERLKEKRTALISRTVTRGLPPAAACVAGLSENPTLKPSGVAWLDDVPAHWKVSKLKHIKASIPNAFVDGPFGSNLKTEHFVPDGDVFVIESGFATRGELDEENLKTIEMEHFLTIKRSSTSPGDIIIAKIGAYFGLNNILQPLTKLAVVSGNSLKLTVNHETCSAAYFHYQLLHLKWCGAIDLLANITAQPALSLGGMSTLSCVHPPLPEQAAIAAYLDSETAKLDALVGKVEEAVERLQEYRTALITAAVTGKIDVRKAAL